MHRETGRDTRRSRRHAATPPTAAHVEADGGTSHPYRVLVVEDDDAMRETVRLWLSEDERWEVRTAADGDEALDRLDTSFDAVLLDRRMPTMSGSQVLDRLGGTDFDGAVIVTSAYAPDDHLTEDDVANYLVKPVSRSDVVETLEGTLDGPG